MSSAEYEVGCAVCRRPVELRDGGLACSTHGVIPPEMLRQTGARRRKQFEPWRRSRVVPLPLKSVAFR